MAARPLARRVPMMISAASVAAAAPTIASTTEPTSMRASGMSAARWRSAEPARAPVSGGRPPRLPRRGRARGSRRGRPPGGSRARRAVRSIQAVAVRRACAWGSAPPRPGVARAARSGLSIVRAAPATPSTRRPPSHEVPGAPMASRSWSAARSRITSAGGPAGSIGWVAREHRRCPRGARPAPRSAPPAPARSRGRAVGTRALHRGDGEHRQMPEGPPRGSPPARRPNSCGACRRRRRGCS